MDEYLKHSEEVIVVLQTPKKKAVFSNKKGGISKLIGRIKKCLKV